MISHLILSLFHIENIHAQEQSPIHRMLVWPKSHCRSLNERLTNWVNKQSVVLLFQRRHQRLNCPRAPTCTTHSMNEWNVTDDGHTYGSWRTSGWLAGAWRLNCCYFAHWRWNQFILTKFSPQLGINSKCVVYDCRLFCESVWIGRDEIPLKILLGQIEIPPLAFDC